MLCVSCDHTLSTSHSPPPKKERLIAGYVVRHVEFAIKVGLNRGTSFLFIYCLYTELHEDGMALDAFVIVLKGFVFICLLMSSDMRQVVSKILF